MTLTKRGLVLSSRTAVRVIKWRELVGVEHTGEDLVLITKCRAGRALDGFASDSERETVPGTEADYDAIMEAWERAMIEAMDAE